MTTDEITTRDEKIDALFAIFVGNGGHTVSRYDRATGAKLPDGVSFSNKLTLVPADIVDALEKIG